MKKLLLLLPLLLTPTAHAVENFNYEAGYRACIRNFFADTSRQEWNQTSKDMKDRFRSKAHRYCR